MDARVELLDQMSSQLRAFLARMESASGTEWDAIASSWRQCTECFEVYRDANEAAGEVAPEDRELLHERLQEVARLHATATALATRHRDDMTVELGRADDRRRTLERHRFDAASGTLCDLRG